VINPELGQFFLRAILGKARAQAAELDLIERLILIEAGEDDGLFAGDGVLMHLQALGADLLHHALHGRVDAANGVMVGFEEWPQNGVARLLNGAHHAVGADDDEAVDATEGDLRIA